MVKQAKKQKPKIPFHHPAVIVGSCLWIGKIPFASGTWASLFACYLFVQLLIVPKELGWYAEDMVLSATAAAAFVFFLAGLWAATVYVKRTGESDPHEVVMDEVAGQFLTFALTGAVYYFLLLWDEETFLYVLVFAPQYLIALFLLFRLFDIWKPGIIGRADREVKGGIGIMLDDLLAAFFATGAFYLLFFTMLYSGALHRLIAAFLPDYAQYMEMR